MLLLYFFFSSAITLFDSQFHVQALDERVHECYAYGDPHVYTWHLKANGPLPNLYQDCYTAGYFPVVKNDFVNYKVQVKGRWMIEVDLYFYNGTSKLPFCLIVSADFEMYADDEEKCHKHGITWRLTKDDTHFVMSVSHIKAGFYTTIQFDYSSRTYAPHYNIFVWQPGSLATRSTGICKFNDADCNPTHRATELELEDEGIQPGRRTITNSQAHTICQTHVNAYLSKSRRAPYQRSANTNNTIANVLAGCEADVIFTGQLEAARSGVSVLMIEELTSDMTSLDSIQTAIDSGVQEALIVLKEANEQAEAEVSQLFGLAGDTSTEVAFTLSTTTTQETTTTTVPVVPLKCGIYQDMYIQTWHPIDQAFPPIRDCLGTSTNFELIRNEYVQYTLHTNGSAIDELTLVLFDDTSTQEICNVSVVGRSVSWMGCEQNGINPSLITTATHETLTIYSAQGNFRTVVTRDIGVFAGRFNIIVYLNAEVALRSTGVCNLLSSCTGS